MVTGIISSLLPTFLLTASLTASSPPQASIARSDLTLLSTASISAYLSPSSFYVVNPGDSLASISLAEYGNKEYWTSIWNDNPWIEDPNIIEAGWQIIIRPTPPLRVEELKAELSDKLQPKSLGVVFGEGVVEGGSQTVVTSVAASLNSAVSGPLNEAQINFLGNCESGMTASRNSGNGYYGAFQFSPGTWKSIGTGYERADLAPIEVQKEAVQRLVSRSSIWTQFPGCSAQMHAAGLL